MAPRSRQPARRSAWRVVRGVALALLVAPTLAILLFRFVPPPLTPLMLIRLIQGHSLRQHWVSYNHIAPALAHAVIASEDNLFCEETTGFDIPALEKQITVWWNGERPRGASTITMQTAKNVFLWPGRDPVRKLAEAWLTPQIALLWPKRRVLEVYLNVAEFGPGLYGAEDAARALFGRPAAELSLRQAAQLAAVLPRPLVWSAAHPDVIVRERVSIIENRIPEIRPLLACTR